MSWLLVRSASLILLVFIYTAQVASPVNILHNNLTDTSIDEGLLLIQSDDCYGCHADYQVMTAPSFVQIADRYRIRKDALPVLTTRVISGSSGVWDHAVMPPHPGLLREDAEKMVSYILQLKTKKQ